MKLLFPICLLGALVGGFPGALVAFFVVASTGIGGSMGEAIWFIITLLLSVGGAFIGRLLAKAIRGQDGVQSTEIILPVVLGLLCGIIGYTVVNWAISHAEPPL
jgi:hypothetical protein